MNTRFNHAIRRWTITILAALLVLCLCFTAQASQPVKNIIILIPDGCGAEQYTLARWAKGAPLAFDGILTGAVKTHIADSVVADSAPAGSCYASGVRTGDKIIALHPKSTGLLPGQPDPGPEALRPVATVLEAAKLLGKSTGLVVTTQVTDATPAAFIAHVARRKEETEIAKQMAHAAPDVLLGGGRRFFLPASADGARQDGRDLLERFRRNGYQTPQTRDQLMAIQGGRVAGLFASDHLRADRDRLYLAPHQPSLAEMTAKAIELLAKNPKGFFLLVEGSQVDWACHINDPGYLVGDLLAFDRAVQTALDFAKADGQTLLIAVSDHNTGGMSIGNRSTDHTYTQIKLDQVLAPIERMKISAAAIWEILGDKPDQRRLRQLVAQWWGQEISREEAELIFETAAKHKKYTGYGLGEVFSAKHTVIGWSTHGHVGGDVPLFAFGPGRPSGLLDAPQVAQAMAEALGVDLRQLDRRLFVEAGPALAGAKLAEAKTKQGWLLTVEHRGRRASLEAGTNVLRLNDGREVALEGQIVRIEPTGKWYLPRQAVEICLNGR